MSADRAINMLVTVTLIEMMMTIGLGVTVQELREVTRDWRLLGRALLANYVCVPAVAVLLLLAFHPPPLTAVGFLILAVCPGAPFIPPLVGLAKGHVPAAVGLMAVLAATSAVLAPLLLVRLVPLVAGSEQAGVDAVRLVTTLLVTQLVPLSAGLAVRHCRPAWALAAQSPATRLSQILNLASIAAILAAQFGMLVTIRWRALGGMTALLLASLWTGWLLGGSRIEIRRTQALTAALRNVGVSLVIATGAFPQSPAVTAVVAYGIFDIFGSSLMAVWWSRRPVQGSSQPAAEPDREPVAAKL